ncbi:EboA domain-containing protein [Pedobacter immunditicola]|uniref:EboA domain-containing protein n=1 Tax=Pedobacter immunditicola TaxID=3133440 RepID=UPI0030AF281E
MSLITSGDKKEIEDLLLVIIKRNLKADAFLWLESKLDAVNTESNSFQLRLLFAQIPRFTGKQMVSLEAAELAVITSFLRGYNLQGWTLERLCRVWILMQLPQQDKISYLKKINDLFESAEMNEQVALYSALPILGYPEEWIFRCEEGIRSNIGLVLEAIMYHNPYPAHFLSEGAWNQMILKAFFTEKNVNHIIGLAERVNTRLAAALNDYIEERLAAHRTVNEEIYRLLV